MKQPAKQLAMLRKERKSYGGELLKTRKGRMGPRPIDTRNSMHLVLRSSQATGAQSFTRPQNSARIKEIVGRFSTKYGIKVLSMAIVGNHLHFHVKLANRFTYKPFIRAVTAAIAMAVTGVSRWRRSNSRLKFWDYRPFTRVIQGFKDYLRLQDYIEINELEGFGIRRASARFFVAWNRAKLADSG